MVEEAAYLRIQRFYGIHIFSAQFKVEDVEILNNTLLADRLWDHHHSSVRQPAQDHLCDRFSVFSGNGKQQFILKDIVFTLRKRSPRFDLNIVFL